MIDYEDLDLGIPDHFKHAAGSQLFWDRIKDQNQRYGKDHLRLIVLAGPTGTGKTYDACSWLAGAKQQRARVGYTVASDYWQYESDVFPTLHSLKCLVIDDYGKQQTEGCLQRISDIVDRRIAAGKKYTLITTNVLSDIRSLDPRLASRMNRGLVVDYTSLPDRREQR